ncbi:Tyrosine-protein kinase CSK [Trichoplax sp. H2]|nr:Tyrosine-protein kinase CSK [Trichoplax sp. H2]|eukprot:RDD37190.1 Tyrosine-protein kinase CSK [Trichoplax sp. H2]
MSAVSPTTVSNPNVGTEFRVLYKFKGPKADSPILRVDDTVTVTGICSQVQGWCYVKTSDNKRERVPTAILVEVHRNPVIESAYDWFHGRITRDQAESRLKNARDGIFLIRESTHYPGDYSISLSCKNGVQHYRIVHTPTDMMTIDNEVFFTDLEKLIAHYMINDMGLVTPLKIACGYRGEKKPIINKQHFAAEGWLLPMEEIVKDSVILGKGEFGSVQKGFYRGRPVAIKSMNASNVATELLLHEASISTHLNHPNLVELIGIAADDNNMYMIVELMPRGSLVDYLRSRGRSVINEEIQLKFALDICEGMCYLSSKNFVHRDLAARNVLLSDNEKAKISDFGLTIQLNNEAAPSLGTRKIAVKWTAPEAVRSQEVLFSVKSDVWSFGIVLWELYSFGRIPYPRVSKDEVMEHIEEGYRMDSPDGCSEVIYQLMSDCWNYKPESRPSFPRMREILRKFSELRFPALLERLDSAYRKHKISDASQRTIKTSVLQI